MIYPLPKSNQSKGLEGEIGVWSQIKELKQTLFRVVSNSFASIIINTH